MRRSLLITVMALGAVVTLLGTTGVIAVFSDSADTPANSFETGALAPTADIGVAQTDVDGANPCIHEGVFRENFAFSFFSTSGEPGTTTPGPHICINNAGSGTLALSASTFDVFDSDTGCTGDEGAVDTTCGLVGGVAQEGELSPLVEQIFLEEECDGGADITSRGDDVAALQGAVFPLDRLIAPNELVCFEIVLAYHPTQSQATIAQTDRVEWRLRFTGTAV
jgi:predicted ribosomally synthesized peptide with SipW-like signal peptide